jgi:hypothetical protein
LTRQGWNRAANHPASKLLVERAIAKPARKS